MFKKPDLKTLQEWVYEAHMASRDERGERWRDTELYDGDQWTQEKWKLAQEAGVDPITVNKVFPVVNLMLGHQVVNRFETTAKGRTQKDAGQAEIMSESVKFVMDQYRTEYLFSRVFKDLIVPGAGFIYVGHNPDPRRERVMHAYRDWKDMFWDPFGDPWLDVEKTRYVFYQPWKDLEVLLAAYPDKRQEISEQFDEFTGDANRWSGSEYNDFATEVEERHQGLGAGEWANSTRKRVRPVEMWYRVTEVCTYATFPDGRVIEIKEDADPMEAIQVVQQCNQLVRTPVTKVRVCTFLGDLVLEDAPSPFSHDRYPFASFIGHIDRWGYPYGVPRQIRGQQEEVNQRRSMALAMVKSRRVLFEKGATSDPDGLWEELNKLNGAHELEDGALAKGKIKVIENGELAQGQMAMMQEGEREIQQISGANDERLGYKSNVQSGVGLEQKVEQSATVTAQLFDHQRLGQHITAELTLAEIQGQWKGPKVLRITDSNTKAERFVTLNEPVQLADGVALRNDISQGVYDIKVADAPQSDTAREQSAAVLMETIKKSPPEIIPQLILLWLEMQNLPNKESLMAKIRPMFGESPEGEDLSPQEIKERAAQKAEAKQRLQQETEQHEAFMKQLEVKKAENDVKKGEAEIMEIMARAQKHMADAEAKPEETDVKSLDADTRREKAKVDAFKTGADIGQKAAPAPQPITPPEFVQQDKQWKGMHR